MVVCGAGSVGRAAQGSTAELRTQLGPRASVSQNSYGPQILLLLLLSSRLKRLPWNFTPRNLLSEPRVMDARFQKELLCSCPLSTDCFKCQQHHNSPLPQQKFQPMFLNRLDTRGIHHPILHRPLNYPQIIFILFLAHIVIQTPTAFTAASKNASSRRLTRRVKVNPER